MMQSPSVQHTAHSVRKYKNNASILRGVNCRAKLTRCVFRYIFRSIAAVSRPVRCGYESFCAAARAARFLP